MGPALTAVARCGILSSVAKNASHVRRSSAELMLGYEKSIKKGD